MISEISVAGVMGYPAKKRHPAINAPSTTASFPCIRNSLARLFFISPLHSPPFPSAFHRNGEIGTSNLAPPASRTGIQILHKGIALIIDGQSPFGAESDAYPAGLAPCLEDIDLPHSRTLWSGPLIRCYLPCPFRGLIQLFRLHPLFTSLIPSYLKEAKGVNSYGIPPAPKRSIVTAAFKRSEILNAYDYPASLNAPRLAASFWAR